VLLLLLAGGLAVVVLPVGLGALVVVTCVSALTWMSMSPAKMLALISWMLPFHTLAIALLFGGLRLSEEITRAIAAWKEVAVLLLCAAALLRLARGRGPSLTLTFADLAIVGLGVTAFGHFLVDMAWGTNRLPAGAQLYGWRDTVFFTFLYLVGRASPEIANDDRVLRRLFAIGAVTSGIAILEYAFVSPAMLTLIGVGLYFQNFLNLPEFTANEYGLPDSYWAVFGGGHLVQRAGSVYLAGQAFAVPFLLIVPAATVWLLTRPRASRAAWSAYVVLWVGFLLTLTRTTIVACALEALLVAALLNRPRLILAVVASGLVALAVGLVAFPGLGLFVWDTLTWQTVSSGSHLKDWAAGLQALADRPLGWGLGNGNQAAYRFGMTPLTVDNQYLMYGAELGIPGLLLYCASACAIGVAAWEAHRSATTPVRRAFGLVVLVATLGIALNALTANLYNSMMLSYLYFWFAGASVTLASRTRVIQAAA
jgi:hypothetical protein